MRVAWSDLTIEEVALFNPAFVGRLLIEGVRAAGTRDSATLPVALTFLLIPMSLHPGIREALPRTIRTSFPGWITAHQELTIEFGDRAAALVPYTKEGLRLALSHEALRLEGSNLAPGRRIRFPRPDTDDLDACLHAANFLGRWFTKSGSTASIFALLGVRP